MISILIPVYNIEVVPLVKALHLQLTNLNIEGEIIVFDDHSSSCQEKNREITSLPGVIYKELDRNYGRSVIRQLLASNAKHDWLLFLDGDSRIIHSDFLHRYLSALKNGATVCTGSRVYPPQPIECNKRLHWKYGMKREAVKGSETVLHTNNFCIEKEIFLQLKFPDFLKGYGYEDSWMEIELKRKGKKIIHIDNHVEHIHIETSEQFLKKTMQALQNLLRLEKEADQQTLKENITLYNTYNTIQKLRLGFVFSSLYRIIEKNLLRNLHSCNPSLFYFDLFRICNLVRLSRSNNRIQ